MTNLSSAVGPEEHSHVFLGSGHEENERRTWGVIILCGVMMVEIAGGSLFGSLALIADGLHMSTHAGAMLIAARLLQELAARDARQHTGGLSSGIKAAHRQSSLRATPFRCHGEYA
jgi:Co/Zn/Cd efflux system component